MKTKLLLLAIFSFINIYSQKDKCGTMKNLEEQIKKDPSLKERMLTIEAQNYEWIEKKGLGFKKYAEIEFKRNSNIESKSTLNTNELCDYNNTYFTSIEAPTALSTTISPSPNCTYGGEFLRINNLIAGNTYRISTIGTNNFDTQITIYPAGDNNAVAFNDDWESSLQSQIYFTPIFSDDYDILINQYGCASNELCASLEVELWNIPRAVITIPVVVHVIHNGEAIGTGTNISDAQIQSQIDVLNEDFRRQNQDILNVPAAFRGVSADPLIQFCLAQQEPNGKTTNGITRHLQPSQSEYNQLSVPIEFQCLNRNTLEVIIKPVTIWDRDKYLNLWVSDMQEKGCNNQSTTLGYAQFPGQKSNSDNLHPELTDGVWISYNVFGKVGNLNSSYNLGRTTTHEVGHWLNLKHIWGDEAVCTADDEVVDTPQQTTESYGCNVFPKGDDCSLSYPGIMFQNYMDYSNDNCLALFTYGQVARMDATLFNQRASLLTSVGCTPSTLGLNEYGNLENIVVYPNPTFSKVFFDNTNSNFKEVTIYNYLGQEVTKNSFNNAERNQEIDMSSLAKGVYILKFKNALITKNVKITKQ